MFKENKYTRIYYKIIANPDMSGYTEKHHIIPKCMGGTDELNNLVMLSARQHFVVHLLLPKMAILPVYRGKLAYALKCMLRQRTSNGSRYIPKSSRIFEYCRTAHKGIPKSAEARRKISLGKLGKKLKPFTEMHKQNISKSQLGKTIPDETRLKISNSLKGKETWMKNKKHSITSLEKMSNSQKTRIRKPASKHSDQAKSNNKTAQLKKVYSIISPNGTSYNISDLKSFCKEHELAYSTMCKKARIPTLTQNCWSVISVKLLHKKYIM